jgi:hypothetical protein
MGAKISVPHGLKPAFFAAFGGTAEVVAEKLSFWRAAVLRNLLSCSPLA